MSGRLWEAQSIVCYVSGRLREVHSVVFYVSGRLWEARPVVFYVSGKFWEAHSVVFYAALRLRGVGRLTVVSARVGPLEKEPRLLLRARV